MTNKPMKIGDSREIQINRAEADFDRACDEAYYLSKYKFGINEIGHATYVDGWERSNSWVEMIFIRYVCTGPQNHIYFFKATTKQVKE